MRKYRTLVLHRRVAEWARTWRDCLLLGEFRRCGMLGMLAEESLAGLLMAEVC